MAKVKSVDEYIASQPETIRPVLLQVRSAIHRAPPAAEETISYAIPAYRLPGGVAIFFSGWKRHFSLHPVTPELLEQLGVVDGPFEINSRGTVRFPLDRPVPATLIARIAKLRAKELTASKRKSAATKMRGAAPAKPSARA